MTDIGGAVSVLTLAYSLYKHLNAMFENQKRQQAEYQRTVIQAKNFATAEHLSNGKSHKDKPLTTAETA